MRPAASSRILALLPVLLAFAGPASAQAPAEVANVQIDASETLFWDATSGADDYNVYRGLLSASGLSPQAQCHADEVPAASWPEAGAAPPAPGTAWYYLVTAESSLSGEGTPGADSSGLPRTLRGRCDPVMRSHILNRLGFGGDEWTRGRLATLGRQGYLDEQMNPAGIDQSGNTEWLSRRAALVPPDTIAELIALDIVDAVYSRRQLEQQAALFWANHFNTDYQTSFQFFAFYQTLFPATRNREATRLHHDDLEAFRSLAFNGTFREMLEISSLSPGMIIYLDTFTNVRGVPNENFARELLELHSMGVDGGYTQQDIVELAKVFTGWSVCKKDASVAGDPQATCIARNLYGTASEPPGLWVRHFNRFQHENAAKTLFAGTPHAVVIPATPANDPAGEDDVGLALDAILAHPSTARFIATKLLRRFVTETPTQQMVDAVVAEWNDAGNPMGVGDLKEVLRAVLEQGWLQPDLAGTKIKTPFEQVVSAFRAARGRTNGSSTVNAYLTRMQELPHRNPVPTGYSELGQDWLDTNNMLERHNFGFQMAPSTGTNFGADVIGLLAAAGISTSPTPNNAPAIVDFFAEVLFGARYTPGERQLAIDFLNTDDNGLVSNYNDARIRETMGFMMGFGQFLEQ